MHLALLSVLHTSITSRKKQISMPGSRVPPPSPKHECETVSTIVPSSYCSSLTRSRVPPDAPGSSIRCELPSNSLASASLVAHRKEEESGSCEGLATAAAEERRTGEGTVEFLPTRERTPSHGGSSLGRSDGEVEASHRQEASQEGDCYNLPFSSTKTAEKDSRGEQDASPCVSRCGVPVEHDEHDHGPPSSLGRAQPATLISKKPAALHCYARDIAQFASQSSRATRRSQGDEDFRFQKDRPGQEPRRGSPQNNNRSAGCSSSSSPSVRLTAETKSGKHCDISQEGRGDSTPSEDSAEVTVSSADAEASQQMQRPPKEAAPYCTRATVQARDEKCEDSTAHRSRKQAPCDSRTEEGKPGNGIVPDHQGSYLACESEGKTTPAVGDDRDVSGGMKKQRPECSHPTPGRIRGGSTTGLSEVQKSECSSERDEEDENDRQRLLAELREEEALEDPDGLQAKKRLAIAECREAILEMQRQIQQRLERYDAFLGHTTQILGERNFYFDKLSCIQRVILEGSYAKTSVGQAVLSIITSKPAGF
ncbi:hypothetical protein CSUI_004898 [Cystoisospora suis]|uniref:Uncharacterized protein n=1 Tax=Cystoisospora suis TaxID=483139 RepID=A0A2C6K9A7_9APIC|nr:hypothetical protein CSUI_004898 [Cystoisospora suis]